MNNRISIKAVIDFTFTTDSNMSPAEIMEEFIDRIKSGDYFPNDLVHLELIPTT